MDLARPRGYVNPEGEENKAKPSSEYYMPYLYCFQMVRAVLARLCHSGVRRVKISHVRGERLP
jgi:hypothetical protein